MSRSATVGLLSGGAQRTTAPIQTSLSLSPSSAIDRVGLIGEAGAMQGRVEPIPRAVAGEHAPGAIRAVGRRGEPDDHDPAHPDRRSRARVEPSTPLRGGALAGPRRPPRAMRRAAGRPGSRRSRARARATLPLQNSFQPRLAARGGPGLPLPLNLDPGIRSGPSQLAPMQKNDRKLRLLAIVPALNEEDMVGQGRARHRSPCPRLRRRRGRRRIRRSHRCGR